jgi:thiol-disulfide isomerase/thioredoxin
VINKLYDVSGKTAGIKYLVASPFWTATQNRYHCQRCGKPVSDFQPGELTLVYIDHELKGRECVGFYCPPCRAIEEKLEQEEYEKSIKENPIEEELSDYNPFDPPL